jgi:hypothetical protein
MKNAALPKQVKMVAGTEVVCPLCTEKVTIVYNFPRGPYTVAHHEKKLRISKTQFVGVECPISGLEIKEGS